MKIIFSLLPLSFFSKAASVNVRGSSQDSAGMSPPPIDDPNGESLIRTQFSENSYLGQDQMNLIVSGHFMLSDVHISSDNKVYGYFCDFSFDQQKQDPSLAPRFIDLYGESRHCQEHHVAYPLQDVVNACRKADGKAGQMNIIEPAAFIFHQPKSGSTLLSNIIAASQPSTRVISDSSALSAIMGCQNCNHELKLQSLQNAMYLLGRATDEKSMYVTFSPSDTVGLAVMRESFPDTKWIFVYRDAHVILQKMMDSKADRRICGTKKRRNPGKAITNYLLSKDKTIANLETDEQSCAAFLATNLATAVEELGRDDSLGRLVRFEEDLMSREGIHDLLEYLEVPSPDWDRIEDQRKKRANSGLGQVWEGEAEVHVSPEVKSATAEFELQIY